MGGALRCLPIGYYSAFIFFAAVTEVLLFAGMSFFERCVVLVADDDPVILRIVTLALTRHGYVVIPAEDGPAALRKCEERDGPIHLALLDVTMPGMSGPQLFQCLQEFHPKIAVLFMSGWSRELITELAPDLKEVHFMAKPFLPRDLVQKINEILGNSEVCKLLEDETIAARA